MLTHNNILASERAYCARLNLTLAGCLYDACATSGHATGFLYGVTAPFLIGARSVLLDIFTPDACLALLEQQRCTQCSAQRRLSMIFEFTRETTRRPFSAALLSLRRYHNPQKVARECQQRGIKLLSVYGSTESSPHAVVNLDDPFAARFMHTDGYAAAGVEIKVVDDARKTLPPGCEGEEASRGPNVFMGVF